MKKILIAITVVGLAVAANAATFSWATGTAHLYVNSTSGSAEAMTAATGSMVLVVLGTAADFSDATIVQTATFSSKASKLGQTSGSLDWAYEDGELSAIQDGKTFAVLFKDSEGKLSQFIDATTKEKVDFTYSISGLEDDGDLWDKSWTFTSNMTSGHNFTAVPEPTSGLLVLLGMAGLALRRKRA